MESFTWLLLELVVPIETWIRLDVGSLPQLITTVALLALIGALAVAVVAAGLRVASERPAPLPVVRSVAAPAPLTDRASADRCAPVGGSGPRAPAPASRPRTSRLVIA